MVAPPANALPVGQEDSFDVSGIGRQHSSRKDTMPAYSFGTADRDQGAKKVYISAKAEKLKPHLQSPGPIYDLPTSLGGVFSGFGADVKLKSTKAKYPDSSVDITCACPDNQVNKFHSPRGIHFGTESRNHSKNAITLRTHPQAALGSCSPGHLDLPFEVKDEIAAPSLPKYSFGPKEVKLGGSCNRALSNSISTPRYTGPGSHKMPKALGSQPLSGRRTAPGWSFPGEKREPRSGSRGPQAQLDHDPPKSAFGKQVHSRARSAPSCGFGTSTRDHQARTHLVQLAADRGPAACMPSPRFNHPRASVESRPERKPLPRAGV